VFAIEGVYVMRRKACQASRAQRAADRYLDVRTQDRIVDAAESLSLTETPPSPTG